MAVGYRVRSRRGTQFRQWATARLSEYLVKAGVIAMSELEILRYTIHDPVILTFQPTPELSRQLDEIEDQEPLLSPVTRLLDARIRTELLDLRNLVFIRASQSRQLAFGEPTDTTSTIQR